LGYRGNITSEFSNARLRIPWQPGILRAIKKSAPDVIIGDGFSQWSLSALVSRLFKGTPFVMCYERTAHTERNAQWYRKMFRSTVLPFVSAMCVNGRLSKEYAISLGISEDRITTGHMVADTAALEKTIENITQTERNAQCMEWQANGNVFLYVGQLIPRKGVAQLLEGWALFEKQGADGTLVLVGKGPEEEKLKQQIAHLGLKNVIFAGAVDYDHIALLYASADVFIMPTLEDNWSLVVPEAMTCNLPIICSKYNGCWPELVHEGVNGWVFDPLNAEETVRVLAEANQNKSKLFEMGQRSKEIVSQYTPRTAAQAILSACQIAINHRNNK
jgi:glycosyltransferase involved in cell wall biosynthesis